MTPPRFQFTIANLFWAMFWAAVSAAALGHRQYVPEWDFEVIWRVFTVGTPMLRSLIATFCLCAAGGALIGRQRKGLLVGGIVLGGWIVWYVIYIAMWMISMWRD